MYYKYLNRNKLLTKLNDVFKNESLFRFISSYRLKQRLESNLKTSLEKRRKVVLEQYLYIKDTKIAEIVVKHLSNDLSSDDSVIFESNPGEALLTQHLLRSGAQLVRVFEDNPIFLDNLKKLQKQYRNRLQIIPKQIQNIHNFLHNSPQTYESDIKECFESIPVREWRDGPPIKFVGVLSPLNTTPFLRFVIKQLIQKELFFSFGRTEFLVFISDKEFKYINSNTALERSFNYYRSVTVLYHTLFDIEILETVPYEEFQLYSTPEESLKKVKCKDDAKLIRLTPKPYLCDMSVTALQDYYYFVNQTFMKRRNYIIPYLENWFPNCGPELIRKGIPVFKYFGDLEPEEVLDLFKHFQNRTDYNNSLYKAFSKRDNYLDDCSDTKEDDNLSLEPDLKDRPEFSDAET